MRRAYARIALLGTLAACGDAQREIPADTALAPPSATDTSQTDSASVRITGEIIDTGAASTPARDVSLVLVTDSAAGDAIFNRTGTCFTCHGERGVGIPNLGPDLRDSIWLNGDGTFASILRVINDGVAMPKASPIGMPSFEGRLSDARRYQVAAYVFSLSHPGSVVADTATAPADTPSPFTIPAATSPPR